MKKGFFIHVNYWKNSQIRELSPLQRGILSDLFCMLSAETNKKWWGFIVDSSGKPLSERAIRGEISEPALSPKTWQTARDEFMARGIFKKIVLKNAAYLYCPIFVEMNPYEQMRKTNTVINQEKGTRPMLSKTDLYIGHDPDEIKPDDEMGTWDHVCRLWIDLSGGKPPVRSDIPMSSKVEIKDDVVRIVDEIGLSNALKDMMEAFEFKNRTGGRINSIEYLLMRWRSRDWVKRIDKSGRADSRLKKNDILRKTITVLKNEGKVKSITELIEYYPTYNPELLTKIGKECGLRG